MGIPKVIHYCWFGHGSKSELIEKCIASWRRQCPDWEIVEWNESNFDVTLCPYTAKAYKMRKYAYLSDVARLKILYDHGGIYMDTDVELLKPLDDLTAYDAWFGYMATTLPNGELIAEINTGGGFGSVAGNSMVKKMLDNYLSFDDTQPFTVCNKIDTELFAEEWPNFEPNKTLRLTYNNMIIIDDVWRYTYHHCVNSWLPWYKRLKNYIIRKIKKK